MATELAVGLSMAQQIVQQQGVPGAGARAAAQTAGGGPAAAPSPELLAPAGIAAIFGVSEADVLSIIESGELSAKRIGSSYRVKRTALDDYLAP